MEQFTISELRRELDPEHSLAPGTTEPTTKIPPWGWALVVLGGLLVLGAVIALSIVLTRGPHAVSVTPTPSLVTVTPNIKFFPELNAAALIFQVIIPPTDGLTKGAYQVTKVQANKIGFVACGVSTQSAFYVTEGATGEVSPPSVLIAPGTTTTNANTYDSWILTTADGLTWKRCQTQLTSATAVCTDIQWPSSASLNSQIFAGTQWTGQSSDIVFSLDPASQITMQNELSLICTSTTNLPGQPHTTAQVLSTFYTVAQVNAIFGVANAASNTVNYVVYNNALAPDCNTLYTVSLDATAEDLLYADLSYDGMFLLVLTTQRLIMYTHTTLTSPFVISDVINFPSKVKTRQCTLDRQYTSNSMIWCQITTDQPYSIVVPFGITTRTFQSTKGRQVPVPSGTSAFINALGPGAIQFLPSSNQLFLIQSDTVGNAASLIIDVSKM